jgi:hypothetical protein
MPERFLDVSHEALIRGWPRLRGWLDEDRAGLRIQRRITETAAEWQRSNRDDDLLYRGARLIQAQEWRARHEVELNPLEREFLDASIALKQRLEERERLQQQAELEAHRLRAREAAQRRKQRITAAVACVLALTVGGSVWGGYYAFFAEHKAYYREFAKRNGFPAGIRQIESETRRMPVSFLLIHKGIVLDGWKVRWKPAFRVVAMNGLLEPTAHHSVTTYLWEGEEESKSEDSRDDEPWNKGGQLGLQNVCQWEFVSTGTGEILYERELDRDGRMVYGLIYSPPESGSTATRLTRFVGPDGFPQLQRRSAEYVMIHYDKEGWEDRIMYHDGKNLPAVGPDGAFGKSMIHNRLGQLTLVLSLDADGHNTINNAGNCGVENKYDESGQLTEAKSLGPDLQPMPVKDGWAILKVQNDRFGRERRATYHGVNGKAVLHKEGYNGWETQYDERGNRFVLTYLGLDGKPTLLADGYATLKSTYDARGNRIARTYLGLDGKPTLLADGYATLKSTYDARGNRIARTYLGLDGKPTLLADGYATLKSTYDARGKETRRSYHGVNGEPVLHKKGYYGWEAQYDERGNRILLTYLGLDGKPTLLADGYAMLESTYDTRGRETQESYHGVNRGPILHKGGYYGWEAQYDERGNRIAITYLGLDGKPTLLDDGFATVKSTYNARGEQTRWSYHGVKGEPVVDKNGNHGWEARYDERGNEIERIVFGLDGKPRP